MPDVFLQEFFVAPHPVYYGHKNAIEEVSLIDHSTDGSCIRIDENHSIAFLTSSILMQSHCPSQIRRNLGKEQPSNQG